MLATHNHLFFPLPLWLPPFFPLLSLTLHCYLSGEPQFARALPPPQKKYLHIAQQSAAARRLQTAPLPKSKLPTSVSDTDTFN